MTGAHPAAPPGSVVLSVRAGEASRGWSSGESTPPCSPRADDWGGGAARWADRSTGPRSGGEGDTAPGSLRSSGRGARGGVTRTGGHKETEGRTPGAPASPAAQALDRSGAAGLAGAAGGVRASPAGSLWRSPGAALGAVGQTTLGALRREMAARRYW
jgi:hypothetical protein